MRNNIVTAPITIVVSSFTATVLYNVALHLFWMSRRIALATNGFNVSFNNLLSEKAKLDMVVNGVVATGVQCRTYMADVSIEQEVKEMMVAAVSDCGDIDMMVADAHVGYKQMLVDNLSFSQLNGPTKLFA
ncbi:hypothetical protein IW262DRAFT_1400589 [Armillaria fumosa]|nr:hypothetical protein IW262DRAFT_1400589 [Armillaria fumosa]